MGGRKDTNNRRCDSCISQKHEQLPRAVSGRRQCSSCVSVSCAQWNHCGFRENIRERFERESHQSIQKYSSRPRRVDCGGAEIVRRVCRMQGRTSQSQGRDPSRGARVARIILLLDKGKIQRAKGTQLTRGVGYAALHEQDVLSWRVSRRAQWVQCSIWQLQESVHS